MADLNEIAVKPSGNGMPIGHTLTPQIADTQVTIVANGKRAPAFDDTAAATIVWEDFNRAQAWLDNNAWLMNWQYVDYLYQSPDFDRDWRGAATRTGRISRFNIAKNRNTMSTAVRRSIFADQSPVLLKAVGKLASDEHAEDYVNAVSTLLDILSTRADFEYNMSLFIEDCALQGTAIAVPGWEEKEITKKYRQRKEQPAAVPMPDGTTKLVNTWESDKFEEKTEEVIESFPCFEYRRLGTTIWDEQWRTPNRPDLTAKCRLDVNYVTFQDLQQMREMDCYENIPSDENLKKFFLQEQQSGNAEQGTQTAMNMQQESVMVMHAAPDNVNPGADPFEAGILLLSRWTAETVMETLNFNGRRLTIRNDYHELGTHGLGYSATWWNIPNCGYGMGIGRLNAGDQRMDQGVLNEVLKMIAYWTNAPLAYDSSKGNAPTQNVVMGLGTLWGVDAGGGDIRKVLGYVEKPPIPAEAWKIYELGKEGGEDLVGANNSVMQGNNTGVQGIGRTAAGANRLASQSDAQVSDPIAHIEYTIKRWYEFMWEMVKKVMPISEIRAILSEKMADEILDRIDVEKFLRMEVNVQVVAGQKLAAKAAIAQLIPFLLQLLQQPQLMEYMHQKGETINFAAVEKIFLRVSELQGAEDIIVPLDDAQKKSVQQLNPAVQRAQAAALQEQLRGKNKLDQIQAEGAEKVKQTIVDKSLDHIEGSVPLELAEARLARNDDLNELAGGIE